MSSGISDIVMTSGISEVIVTADDPEWLATFTRTLVEERLCACAQHFAPIRSIYRWQGDIEDSAEVRVALHTRSELVAELIERIERDHPYEVPCVLSIAIDDASPAYIEWVRKETAPVSPSPVVRLRPPSGRLDSRTKIGEDRRPGHRAVDPPRTAIRTARALATRLPYDAEVTNEGALAAEATDLLQHLIRNECVNDGTPASGQEHRSADLLATYLEGSGVEMETYEPLPGRTSLVAKLPGTDPSAPSLTLLGHTDVVPANGEDWRHDPFGGELIDGEVWGRGAIDMLNLTATMATGLRHLAKGGFRPAGDLTYVAVADEEAIGIHGAKWLCEHQADEVNSDYVITESGGFPSIGADGGTRLPVIVGEKGIYWCILTVKGVPGHASQPLRTDNALVKAAEIVRRIDEYRPQAEMHEIWHGSSRASATRRSSPSRSSMPTRSTTSATTCRSWGWPARPMPAPTPPWPPP